MRRMLEKQALPFVLARYIQTLDVISEVNFVLLRRKQMFETNGLYPNLNVISKVNFISTRR